MSTLQEIEAAAESLPPEEKKSLLEWLLERVHSPHIQPNLPHSVLDIPPVSLGHVLRPVSSEDDLLGEMLED